ncbi:MAG: hypothetical protein QCI38_09250, partial [Candidatus Thermoplasmatota archaeon]|nr:hypothetical protein [Candidatus Thermoplasmatota archaeon]
IWKLYIRSALMFYEQSRVKELDLRKSLAELMADYQTRKRGGSFYGDGETEKLMDKMQVSSFKIEVLE